MKAVIYARTSTEEQTISIDEQVKICRDWCQKHGIEVLLEVKEHVSGATPFEKRPEFSKVLPLIKSKSLPVNYIVVYALDRLTRSLNALIRFYNDMESLGIRVVSVNEPWTFLPEEIASKIPDPTFRDFIYGVTKTLILHVMGFFAEWWIRNIRERTRIAVNSEIVKRKRVEKMKQLKLKVFDELDDKTKNAIAILYRQGYSIKSLAKMFNLSEHLIKRVLVEKNLLVVSVNTCPRCFHKMEYDEVTRGYKCKYCGFEKPMSESSSITEPTHLRK